MKKKEFLMLTGIGAVAWYLLDPARGRRRRALARGMVIHAGHRFSDVIEVAGRDARNRTQGAFHKTLTFFRPNGNGRVLKERIRSILGRHVSHPGSIQTDVYGDRVILSGPILKSEVDKLLKAVIVIKGVRQIENRLDIYDEPGNVLGLQGTGRAQAAEFGRRKNLTPLSRLALGSMGTTLFVQSLRKGTPFRTPIGLLGTALLSRAVTNMEFKRLVGFKTKRHAVDFHKIINIEAPVSQVYSFWSNFENFPKFMRNVLEVKPTNHVNQWRWAVRGPAGFTVEWDAELTEQIPNKSLAWKTTPDSFVQHEGRVHFSEKGGQSTQIDLRLSYNPGAGALGHVISKIFGADPKKEIDEDMVRLKTFLESGKAPRDAAQRAEQA